MMTSLKKKGAYNRCELNHGIHCRLFASSRVRGVLLNKMWAGLSSQYNACRQKNLKRLSLDFFWGTLTTFFPCTFSDLLELHSPLPPSKVVAISWSLSLQAAPYIKDNLGPELASLLEGADAQGVVVPKKGKHARKGGPLLLMIVRPMGIEASASQ